MPRSSCEGGFGVCGRLNNHWIISERRGGNILHLETKDHHRSESEIEKRGSFLQQLSLSKALNLHLLVWNLALTYNTKTGFSSRVATRILKTGGYWLSKIRKKRELNILCQIMRLVRASSLLSVCWFEWVLSLLISQNAVPLPLR